MDDIVVGDCYRLPDQEEQVDEDFCRVAVASQLQPVVLMGDVC